MLVLPITGFAATYHVPDDFPNIQNAINGVVTGDTIIVRDGVYTQNIDFLGKDITLKSENGPVTTIINGNAMIAVSFASNPSASETPPSASPHRRPRRYASVASKDISTKNVASASARSTIPAGIAIATGWTRNNSDAPSADQTSRTADIRMRITPTRIEFNTCRRKLCRCSPNGRKSKKAASIDTVVATSGR